MTAVTRTRSWRESLQSLRLGLGLNLGMRADPAETPVCKLTSSMGEIRGDRPRELLVQSLGPPDQVAGEAGGPVALVLDELQRLEVTGVRLPSFSRPHVSDDNPYPEALARTLKHAHEYPKRPFLSLEEAQRWAEGFVLWYNSQHHHSAIWFGTPEPRHFDRERAILASRKQVYEEEHSRKSQPLVRLHPRPVPCGRGSPQPPAPTCRQGQKA